MKRHLAKLALFAGAALALAGNAAFAAEAAAKKEAAKPRQVKVAVQQHQAA